MSGTRVAVAFGMLVALTVGPAHASFIASICNDVACVGGGDIIITDQVVTPDGDFNPVVGVIVANGVVGGLTTAVNVSQSKPAIGSAAAPQLDLNFTATGTGDVWLYASDTGFTGAVPLRLEIGGTSSGSPISVAVSAAGGSTNTNVIPGAPVLGTLGPFIGSPFTGSTPAGFVGNTANPYALTLAVHVVQNGGTSTGDALLVSSVPEPASAVLLGLGLGVLGLFGALRRLV